LQVAGYLFLLFLFFRIGNPPAGFIKEKLFAPGVNSSDDPLGLRPAIQGHDIKTFTPLIGPVKAFPAAEQGFPLLQGAFYRTARLIPAQIVYPEFPLSDTVPVCALWCIFVVKFPSSLYPSV
jgi:hypothetical protein